MGTMNISLPDKLRAFVEDHVERAGYGTSSEYVRELIRRDQERLKLRERLLKGAASPLSGEVDTAYLDALRARGRRKGRPAAVVTAIAGKPLLRRAIADRDIEAAIDRYRSEAPAAAAGFVDALERAFRGIRRAPAIGSPRYAHELDLPGLRFWSCRRHPYLVFYVEHPGHIEIWRVLHARRDLPPWLHDDGRAP